MRCPECHATNPDGADFCGQCYIRFDRPPDGSSAPRPDLIPEMWDAAAHAHVDVTAPAAPDHQVEPAPDGEGAGPAPAATAGRFTAVDGELIWRCAVCGTRNDVAAFTCVVCGARMDVEPGGSAAVDWTAARRAEVLVPGLGHLRAGQTGMGAARTGMVVLWLIGGVLLLLSGGAGVATALPLLIGVVGIWATGPGDLDAVRAGKPPRLDARGFMYLVTGVTLGVIVAGGVALVL